VLFLTVLFLCKLLIRISANMTLSRTPTGYLILITSIGSILSYNLFQQVKDLNALPHQLANFRVRQAKSFCCENNHIVPETGLPIRCDRELVYQKLTERYLNKFGGLSNQGEELGESEELERLRSKSNSGEWSVQKLSGNSVLQAAALDTFDRLVHNELASDLLRECGRNALKYHQILYAAAPWFWFSCDLIPAVISSEEADILVWALIEKCVDAALVLPAFFGLLYQGLMVLQKRSLKGPIPLSFHLIVPCVILSLTWAPCKLLNGWIKQRLPFIIFSGWLVLLNIGMFSNLYCRCVAEVVCKRSSS